MANITTAHGWVTLRSESVDDLIAFILMQLERTSYLIELCREEEDGRFIPLTGYSRKDLLKFLKDNIDPTKGFGPGIKLAFTGNGYTSIDRSIKYFLAATIEHLDYQDYEDDERMMKMINKPECPEYEAEWLVYDSEPGNNFIIVSEQRTRYGRFSGVKVHENHICDVTFSGNYNVENLLEYGFYEEGEVFDRDWILNNMEKALVYIKEDYEKSRPETVDDFDYDKLIYDILEDPDEFKYHLEKTSDVGVYDNIQDLLEALDLKLGTVPVQTEAKWK